MNIGLYQSASSLSALERWQDAVSQNITSSQIPGFKKQTVSVGAEYAGELKGDPTQEVGHGEGTPMWYPRASYGVSYANGDSNPTRREFDFAIGGAGFFTLRDQDGRMMYTRNGGFAMTPDRTIVSRQGFDVMVDGENTVQLLPQGGKVTADGEGNLFQNGVRLGQLEVVSFPDTNQLIPMGGGLFYAAEGVEPEPVDAPEVMQGYLESSNVEPLREMVDLVSIARAYEANQKMISHRDKLLEKTIEKLG